MEDALWTRFARLAWVRGSLVKYVNLRDIDGLGKQA
jgi:hypothetical protein